ncbi:MAG: flagellar filament capping protein FliD [Spirochaetaceae bacterium]|nr:flagellar filament capping protein FliD [Spirochaetaceae bacterium]
MPDFSIPGVNSKYKTDEVIQKLVDVEKIPLRRMEDSIDSYKNQAQVWRELNQSLGRLRDASRALFSFQNPFGERTAISADEGVLTATVTREAAEGKIDILVKRVATNDRFLSKPLELDYSVPEGRYTFRVGDDEVRFSFRGGKLSSFIQTLNSRGEGIVRAQAVRATMNTQTLMIEAVKTGAENPLSFHDDAVAFAENAGLIEKALAGSRKLTLEASAVRPWQKPASAPAVQDGVLKLSPGEENSLPLGPAINLGDSTVLELEVKVTSRRGEIPPPPSPPPGPSLPASSSVSLGDVTVQSSPSRAALPEWKPPEAPKVVDDFTMMFAGTDRGVVSLPELEDTQGFVKLTIPLASYGNEISALYFRNNNTHRDIEVRGIHIYDPSARGDYMPAHPASIAADAEMELGGIPITRSSNSVSDLLPGVTINLEAPGPRPVELRIEPDRETIKNSLINFVGYYNQLVANINILTRKDEAIIQELSYFSPEEQEKAREKLGLFNGDISLMQMRGTFQNIMMSPYTTSAGEAMALLAQVGISTNSRAGGGSFDAAKMRGYLEIDENRLDESLRGNIKAVQELFGSDTTGDLIPDSGVAVAMDTYIRPLVQVGGIIPARLSTIDSQISQTNRKIDNYNRYLDNFEKNLRHKYGVMEGALGSLEKSSQSIENFNRNSSNNR